MRVAIDASNLRGGGGITHLVGLLSAAAPEQSGVTEVIVWAPSATLQALPARPWLSKVKDPLLDKSLAHRLYWRRFRLPLLAAGCDVIFSPGGGLGVSSKPVVTMFRNMLPFEPGERARYGWSWMR